MNDSGISFAEFEKAVMQKIFERKNKVNDVLREQYCQAQVVSRKFTGVGFFTEFKVPESVPRVDIERSYGDVIASINDSAFEFGFVLFIEDGLVVCLEGYTWADSWPEVVRSFELKHSDEMS